MKNPINFNEDSVKKVHQILENFDPMVLKHGLRFLEHIDGVHTLHGQIPKPLFKTMYTIAYDGYVDECKQTKFKCLNFMDMIDAIQKIQEMTHDLNESLEKDNDDLVTRQTMYN